MQESVRRIIEAEESRMGKIGNLIWKYVLNVAVMRFR